MPFWHPKGMIVWNALEDLRRRENARRGYVEVKTSLLYDVETWVTSGHWEKFRDDMFLVLYGEDRTLGMKPMNCPGHMLLFGSALRSYRDLPPARSPRRCTETSAQERFTACCASSTSPKTTHTSSSPRADRGGDLRRPRLRQVPLRPLWDDARFELPRGPRTSSGPTRNGTSPRARFVPRWSGGDAVRAERRRRCFYGPKIDLHMTDVMGRSWQMGTIQLDSQMPRASGSRTWAPTTPSTRRTSSTVRCLARYERFIGILIEHYGGAFPLWLAPFRCGSSRWARITARRRAHWPRSSDFRVEVDDSDETVGKRIRNAEVEKIPYTVVYGDRESEDTLAVRERGGEQSTRSLDELVKELAASL